MALRYFNAAGADPDGEIGEAHDPETHLIPLALDVAMGLSTELVVFGNEYPTRDGTCIRDYIHVTDLARAHVLALRRLEQNDNFYSSINLGTGNGTSILELVKAGEAVTGMKIPYRIAQPRPGDPPVLVADPSEASAMLGWKPEFGEIGRILDHAWNFHRKTRKKG